MKTTRNIMQIWAMANNEICLYDNFKTRQEANELFIKLKTSTTLLATNNNGDIRFWIGDKDSWIIPIIERGVEATDWRTVDSFETGILFRALNVVVRDESRECPFETGDKSYSVKFKDKHYWIVEEFCKYDDQLADMYGWADKYMQYTFYDDEGNELSAVLSEL